MLKKIKNYFFFLGYFLLNPHLCKLLFKGIYIPVYIQYEWLKKYDIKTIVDVGAYKGRVFLALHQMFPKASIFAFEPVYENYKPLKRLISSSKLKVENMALGDRKGTFNFYKNIFLPSSSLLPLKKVKGYEYMSKVKKIKVRTDTLDNYFENTKTPKHVFLKIDTQGTEALILAGANEFLKRVSIVFVESSFNGFYERESTFAEIYKILQSMGFKFMATFLDSEFYPSYNLKRYSNAVFVNTKLVKADELEFQDG